MESSWVNLDIQTRRFTLRGLVRRVWVARGPPTGFLNDVEGLFGRVHASHASAALDVEQTRVVQPSQVE